jgi:two-component system, OmpR family, sensor histidine kinase TctE
MPRRFGSCGGLGTVSMNLRAEHGRSIRRRLLLVLVGPILIVLLAGALIDYFTALQPMRRAYDQSLADAALAVAAHVRVSTAGSVTADLPEQAVAMLRTDAIDSIYFRVTAPDGSYVAGDSDLQPASALHENPTWRDGVFRGEEVRLVGYRTTTAAGPVNITVAETLHKRDRISSELLSTIVAVDLLQLAAILLLVWLGIGVGLEPLRALRAQIAARSRRELAPLDLEPVPVEVRGLVEALNRLFATVRDNTLAQRRFLENAAHQLRTPLTGLQAQLELLVAEEGTQEVRDRLVPLHDATRRLAHTAHQFLALARSDSSADAQWEFAPVDLESIVEASVTTHLSSAIAGGIDLGAETQSAVVLGAPWLLRELLSNLIDNAVTHTPAGGSVTVYCGTAQDTVFLEVVDTGSGIPLCERERVTERFFRGKNARGEGSGLGLAIVTEIARVHGAQLTIGGGDNDIGAKVRVEFPPAPA